jgi:hypothetical protein
MVVTTLSMLTLKDLLLTILEILFTVVLFVAIYPVVIVLCLLMAPFIIVSVRQIRERQKSRVE